MLKLLPVFLALLLAACTFDYGEGDGDGVERPDIIMVNVKYVRVRSGDPVARFQAYRAERFENRQIMELLDFTFEQFGQSEEEVNALGMAGAATVETNTGNIRMRQRVRMEVESEDFIIETYRLEWRDRERRLFSGADDEVILSRSDGTNFRGFGFSADTRDRTWEFSGGVSGIFVHVDDDDDNYGEGALYEVF